MIHIPVLVEPIIELLDIQPDDIVVDGTIGFGGHASMLLEQLGPNGRYIGFDQDEVAVHHCQEKFKGDQRVTIVPSNFDQVREKLDYLEIQQVNKVLLDLGMSSFHLDGSGRGFTFQKDEPLDMRMNPSGEVTAASILKRYDAKALSDMFFHNGELHHNKRLVDAIMHTRRKTPVETTFELVELIRQNYKGPRGVMMKISSQVFQALRIEVNDEYNRLRSVLDQLLMCLAPGGIAAVITFHSSEDRIVKQFVKGHKGVLTPLNKHVIQATQEEIKQNSRSKPAKLRVVRKL